jgi:hypothetical protein
MPDDTSEWIRMATVEASIEVNNFLYYDENLDSSLLIAAASARHNISAGETKHFLRRLKRRTNWRLHPEDRIIDE